MKLLVSVLFIFVTVSVARAQNIKYVQVKPKKVTYAPVNFYVNDITDDRPDKASIGTMDEQGKQQTAALETGVAACVKAFMANNTGRDKAQQSIVLHINKLNFDMKKEAGGWQINAISTFSFYAGDIKLIEYTGKGHGETDSDPGDYMGTFIQQTLENSLKKFDNWWAQNKGKVATSSDVKINVIIGKTSDVPNSIVYSARRPLQIAEFEGRPSGNTGPEMAATMSGLGFGYYSETENGQLVLNITVTPYFDKSQSWFKEGGKNPFLLAHEQLHFDITAIKACELATTIRNTSFTKENFEKLLDQLRQQNQEETDKEEEAYDNDTNHGTIPDKQEEWDKKVKEKVKEVGCY